MITEKDFRLLVTTPDGGVRDVILTKSVHTESGFFLSRAGLRSWLAEFNLRANVGKEKEAQVQQSLRGDTTITSISDNGSFWGPEPFKGVILVDLTPTKLWNQINRAQESGHACLDLTEVTGLNALRNKLQLHVAKLSR